MRLITATGSPPPSLARVHEPTRPPLRVAAVQQRWHPDPDEHRAAIAEGVRMAAAEGAQLVCLQELTLSPYFAVTAGGPQAVGAEPEELPGGATFDLRRGSRCRDGRPDPRLALRARGCGRRARVQHGDRASRPRATLLARTRKLHIPVTAGYYEDHYFRPGPPENGAPVVALAGAQFGFPTCWDQWFPELARAYSLGGAEVLVYPTAIGSEPDHPDFDTEPLWERVIVANGITNGTFMIAVNRIGTEGTLTFYGSSFISDPYGRVLVQAPRDEPAVLVADLDLDQRRDWLELFPFLTTRRPDAYEALVERRGDG